MADQTPPSLFPIAPWLPKNLVDKDELQTAYETCERGEKSYCIHSKITRVCAKQMPRQTRYIQTYDGYLWWSEFIEDYGWVRFRSELSPRYVKMIDAFDRDGKHFKYPKKDPHGATEFVEFCPEYVPPSLEVRRERNIRYNIRKREGKVKNIRERQLPKILERHAENQ